MCQEMDDKLMRTQNLKCDFHHGMQHNMKVDNVQVDNKAISECYFS